MAVSSARRIARRLQRLIASCRSASAAAEQRFKPRAASLRGPLRIAQDPWAPHPLRPRAGAAAAAAAAAARRGRDDGKATRAGRRSGKGSDKPKPPPKKRDAKQPPKPRKPTPSCAPSSGAADKVTKQLSTLRPPKPRVGPVPIGRHRGGEAAKADEEQRALQRRQEAEKALLTADEASAQQKHDWRTLPRL